MRSNKRKWVIPGVLTVLLGTAGTMFVSEPKLEADLTSRSQALLSENDLSWANVEFDSRDATISGTAENADQQAQAQELIEGIHGVRVVNSNIDLLPSVSPYPFLAKINSGDITLSGGAPNDIIRQDLIAKSGASSAAIDLLAGSPDRDKWLNATDFALTQLKQFEVGQVSLTDLEISASGQPKSRQAFDELNTAFANALPTGVSLGEITVSAPIENPYLWSAQKHASGDISITGFAPNAQVMDRLGENANSTMLLAQGAPDNFEETAISGLQTLSLLKEGVVSLDAKGWSIKGDVPSQEVLTMLDSELDASVWQISVIAPPTPPPPAPPAPVIPTASPYLWSGERIGDGSYSLSGYVPQESLKQYQLLQVGYDANENLEIAIGEPDDFSEATNAGLSALAFLEKGRVAYNGTQYSLVGLAKTDAAKANALDEIAKATNIKDWEIDIAVMEPPIPTASPYLWKASKAYKASVVLSGYMPNKAIKNMIARSAINDGTTIARGSPKGFGSNALAAISALDSLDYGAAGFDGENWYVSGMLAKDASLDDLSSALNRGNTGANNWLVNVKQKLKPAPEPEPELKPEPEPIPVASPDYRFVATLGEDKQVTFNGDIPTLQMQNYITVLAGNVARDNLVIDFPAPDNFNRNLFAGLRSLRMLESGQLSYRNKQWYLFGEAKDDITREKALNEIEALSFKDMWSVNIKVQRQLINTCNDNVSKFADNNVILFDVGKAIIKPESDIIIQHLALLLSKCPGSDIHVQGHTDSDGSNGRNLTLSVDRAEAVVNALAQRGIDPKRIFAIGYGESMPIATNDNEEGKRKNRRIVFSVYKNSN